MNHTLIWSPAFVRAARRFLKKYPSASNATKSILRLMAEDAFDPRLRTHKLKGRLEGCWASSGGYNVRIVFEFVRQGGAESILLLSIGTHDEVY